MTRNLCSLCEEPIPSNRRLNSVYCSEECYYAKKKSREVNKNKKKREKIDILDNDAILHDLYLVYQSNYYICAAELLKRDFNWCVYAGIVEINSVQAKKSIRYAYTLFINQTIIIWKL